MKIPDGGSVPCTAQIPYAEWSIQGYVFHSTLKLIPIGTYDMILGMDWLQAFSPMKVHWLQRWVQIPYGPHIVVLHGSLSEQLGCLVVQLHHLSAEENEFTPSVHSGLLEIQALLSRYQHLFRLPTELPPCRAGDHSIPFIPGAQPVSARPYHWP